MSIIYIRDYQAELEKLRRLGGKENEEKLRPAFANCMQKYCRDKRLTLIVEKSRGRIKPDGTVLDDLGVPRGYWEAKGPSVDIDRAIDEKTRARYPKNNIIYENTETAVLIQGGEEVMRIGMREDKALDKLIQSFLDYFPPEIENFHKAVGQFKRDLPQVLAALRKTIDDALGGKPAFREAADDFLAHCKTAINPEVEAADVREMLIQHILTKDIFFRVFDEDQFHKENNIAARLEKLEETFFTGNVRRETLDRLKSYYSAITRTAAGIADHHEKQKFLKNIYENFYRAYNPKAAKRLGVVYTPNEIVNFMIRAADELTRKNFGRGLADNNVHILDPAAGTGTYITDLIEFIPKGNLAEKYEREIHANEVGILPYYIANLNIEYTYKQKMGKYKEFPNICFVDTLDNLSFSNGKGQSDIVGAMSQENLERVQRQNKERISVIIGNPPYFANQRNENDNNKSRKYPGIDARIKCTYVAESAAQKTKQYDMYKRFIRWASDRLDERGVLAFITNRAYIEKENDDGFRKTVIGEFDELYVVDLGGDLRKQREVGAVNTPNVFGIMTGVAIGFFVRKDGGKKKCDIYYTRRGNDERAEDKLAFLADASLGKIDFQHIVPDAKHNWLNQTDNDFAELLCVADKTTKNGSQKARENAVFKLFSLGVSTNRDEWVYDLDRKNLQQKTRFFAKTYNELVKNNDESYPTVIKWSSGLREKFKRGKRIAQSKSPVVQSLYRPFVTKHYFAEPMMSDRLTKNHYDMFGAKLNLPNKVIWFSISTRMDFTTLASTRLTSLGLFVEPVQCLPLHRYDADGKRHSNITAWGLAQFRDYYGDKKITAENIFHYAYAVFHSPAYREKYAVNLQREFPRLPFYADFSRWVEWGKELVKLHADFEKVAPYPLKTRKTGEKPGKTKLRANKKTGEIALDEQTTLTGIPPEAWQYQLGARSALEWVLDQYKEKKPRDPMVREKFNAYRFHDHKPQVIDLLKRVCTVSVETMRIVGEISDRSR